MNKQLFFNLGVDDAEMAVYLAALQGGESIPARLASMAGVKRPTLYLLLPKLIEKGLLSETKKGKRRFLVAEDPSVFIDNKKSDLEQFEQIIPELRSLLVTSPVKPSINFYQGVEGIKKVYLDNLRTGLPLLDFVGLDKMNPEVSSYSSSFYIRERIRRKIPIKIIISGIDSYGKTKLVSDSKAFREVRMVKEKLFPCPLEIFIYGDKVSFIVFREDSDPCGIIVHSQEISLGLKSLFELAWLSAGK